MENILDLKTEPFSSILVQNQNRPIDILFFQTDQNQSD